MSNSHQTTIAGPIVADQTLAVADAFATTIDWALHFGTVARAFGQSAAHFGEADVLEVLPETAAAYGVEAGAWSYARLQERVASLYEAYFMAGLRIGDRVGLLLENRPAFFAHWLALNGLGVSVVPISAEMRVAELAYLIGHSEVKLVVAVPSHHALLREAAARENVQLAVSEDGGVIPTIRSNTSVVEGSSAHSEAEGQGSFVGNSESHQKDTSPRRSKLPDLGTECALLYTSGTTGRPKGCVLTNEYFLFAGGWYLQLGGLCEIREGADRLITPLPLNHMNAMACSSMAMLLSGGCIIQVDRFHPKTWWQSVRDSRATILHYLGVMPSMLMSAEPSSEDAKLQVRFGFGAGVDRRLHEPFERRFGFPLVEGWAMTESGVGGCIIENREPRRTGQACFGKPMHQVEVRLIDDARVDVPLGTPGQLLVRSRLEASQGRHDLGFFKEYLKDASATAEAWAGGWLNTGDMVRADAQGYLYFVDRQKNVIRRSGENISAVEVETVLRRFPGIKDVAVAATPDEVRGDEVLACVILKDEHLADLGVNIAETMTSAATTHRVSAINGESMQLLARAITQHCLAELAYYKAPGWIAFVPSLPLTLTQKVQRAELKKLAAELPGQAHCVDTRSLKKRV